MVILRAMTHDRRSKRSFEKFEEPILVLAVSCHGG